MALAILAAPKPNSSRLGTMRCLRLIASDCATDTLSTKPTNPISSAGTHSTDTFDQSNAYHANDGNPAGTSPTTLTPAVRCNCPNATATVAATTASMGASLASVAAKPPATPIRGNKRGSPPRAHHKNAKLLTPIMAVAPLSVGRPWAKPTRLFHTPRPAASTPSTCLSWLSAINNAEPLMNPLITG